MVGIIEPEMLNLNLSSTFPFLSTIDPDYQFSTLCSVQYVEEEKVRSIK